MPTGNQRLFYRSRHGVCFGVCRGIADHLRISVFWVRALFVLAALTTAVWPMIGLYVLLAAVMKPEPVAPMSEAGEQEFYESYTSSRAMAVERVRRKFDNLSRRIERLEHVVTSRDFDWKTKFES